MLVNVSRVADSVWLTADSSVNGRIASAGVRGRAFCTVSLLLFSVCGGCWLGAVNEKLEISEGVAGGGMVEVEMNGLQQMTKLTIEPSLVEKNEREMLEDLIPAAVNEAIQKSKELHVEEMKSLTDGFNIPGLDSAIEKFTG